MPSQQGGDPSPDVVVLNTSGCFSTYIKMLQVTVTSWAPTFTNLCQVARPHNWLINYVPGNYYCNFWNLKISSSFSLFFNNPEHLESWRHHPPGFIVHQCLETSVTACATAMDWIFFSKKWNPPPHVPRWLGPQPLCPRPMLLLVIIPWHNPAHSRKNLNCY